METKSPKGGLFPADSYVHALHINTRSKVIDQEKAPIDKQELSLEFTGKMQREDSFERLFNKELDLDIGNKCSKGHPLITFLQFHRGGSNGAV